MSSHTAAKLRTPSLFASLLGILALCAAPCAIADTTSLTIAGTTKGTSNAPVTMQFPIARSGDLSYEAILNYHTVDGSALAGTDYTSASGSIVIPAGASSAMIPVTLHPNTGLGATSQFQMIVDSAVGIGPTPKFATQQVFVTGVAPESVISADVNGDGKSDLIVANLNSNTISVLLNITAPGATTPSFSTQQTFAAGTNPNSVTAVDVNGDGKPDLIAVNYADSTVSVLLNTTAPGATTPSFAPQQTFATGNSPAQVIVADLNGDGEPDLIVTNHGSNTISVLRNTTAPGATTPSFAAQQIFATGSNPYSIIAADVNGDGKLDLIVSNLANDNLSVLLNTTTPGAAAFSFAAAQTFATGSYPSFITAADVNGDGKPDLIVANQVSGTISVLLNTTLPGAVSSSFAAQQTFAAGENNPISVAVADVNGDGRPDLIVTDMTGQSLSVLPNTTVPGAVTVSFTTPQAFGTGAFPIFVTSADVNGDGKPDLIVTNEADNTVSVLLNTTAQSAAALNFAAQQTFGSGSFPRSVTTTDLNGDGKPDLIVANEDSDTVSTLLNTTAPGASIPTFAEQQTFVTGNNPISVTAADVNGDGKPDLIVTNFQSNTVSILLDTTAPGAATSSFAAQQTFATGNSPLSVTVADVNGDGLPDLIVANWGSNTVSVLLNTTASGAATLSFAAQQTFATGIEPSSVIAADVNGDGKPDLIVTNSNSYTISVLLNTTAPGAATPSFAAQQTVATETMPLSTAVVDVNGDGKPDLIVANWGSETVSVLLNTTVPGAATLSFAAQQAFVVGLSPTSVAAADVNGDGRPDLIVSNVSNDTISVLLNTTTPGATTPSFAGQQTFASGNGSNSVAAADVNGDGMLDLIVTNQSDNTIAVLLNTQYQTTAFGSPVTGTIVHDYIFADGFGP